MFGTQNEDLRVAYEKLLAVRVGHSRKSVVYRNSPPATFSPHPASDRTNEVKYLFQRIRRRGSSPEPKFCVKLDPGRASPGLIRIVKIF